MRRFPILLLVTCVLAACGGAPSEEAPAEQPAGEAGSAGTAEVPPMQDSGTGIVPPPAGSGSGEAGLTWSAPEGWTAEAPANQMRKAQYKVGADGECVVYYFGPGQGGDPASNAGRWASQFAQPDGSSSQEAMKTESLEVHGMPVLWVELKGTYQGSMAMAAQPTEPKPGQMLLGAIAEGPDANWFFKFTGPESLVQDQADEFRALIESLQPGA